jgi:hypothetical protein
MNMTRPRCRRHAGIIVAVAGLIPTFAGWYEGGETEGAAPGPGVSGQAVNSAGAPPATNTNQSAADSFTFLSTISPQAGAANLAELPRDLRDDPAYGRAIVITCPSNNSSDKLREVTYSLRGNYLDFTAVVKPVFKSYPDARAHVFVLAVRKQPDDRLVRTAAGEQLNATGQSTGPLAAEVEKADAMAIQVRCDHPDGVVIISDARLVRSS